MIELRERRPVEPREFRHPKMPAPFPGMDPWLKSSPYWGDFHSSFAGEIRNQLNAKLPEPFYATQEMRPEVGVAFDDRHYFVEIRDSSQNHRLVTLIEILSPSNKRSGPDRLSYARKQAEVLASDANLIEIDLLRGGENVLADDVLRAELSQVVKHRPYNILINRACQRGETGLRFQEFAVGIREALPVIPIPLSADTSEPTLDLEFVFQRVYESGPYRRGAINYESPTNPALDLEDAAWANELLRSAGLLP